MRRHGSRSSPRTTTDPGLEDRLIDSTITTLARQALVEDVGRGDVTTRLLVESWRQGEARIVARTGTVVAGVDVARAVFEAADPRLEVFEVAEPGRRLRAGDTLLKVRGACASILTAERTALNFLQRLCGIASAAAEALRLVQGTGVELLDTRKTTPGLRCLEKAAVRVAGFAAHRAGLDDGILIKDNHIALCGSPADAVRRARGGAPALLRIEIEIEELADLETAIEAGADVVMLDNFTPPQAREAVRKAGGRVRLEASGGITPATLAEYAATGVDAISLGYVTHSAVAADLALELHAGESDGA